MRKLVLFMLLVMVCLVVVPLSGTQAAYSAVITKCKVKAGKTAGLDSISFSGTLGGITVGDLNNVTGDRIRVMVGPKGDPIVYEGYFDVEPEYIKKGKYTSPKIKPLDKTDPKTLFKLDVNKGTFSFTAKNVDLTGLSSPFDLQIEIGIYRAVSELGEDIVNGKKPIPIQFMRGVRNILRVDKARVKKGKKYNTDSLSCKGAFTTAGVFDKAMPVIITVGNDTFIVSGGEFISKKGVESCKASVGGGSLVSAKFDPAKCTFTISIKNALFSGTGNAVFGVDVFGNGLQAPNPIILPPDPIRPEPPRPYTFWELTQYDQPGSSWTYAQRSFQTIVTVNPYGSAYRVREMDDGVAGADWYYYDENDGAHLKSFEIAEDYLGLDMDYDFDLLVWPETLVPGQKHSDTSPMTGWLSLSGYGNVNIHITGTASSQITKVGTPKQIKVPYGTYQTVQFDQVLTLDGTMRYKSQEVGTLKLVFSDKNYVSVDFGVVKRTRKATISAKIYGEGSIKESFSAPYVLTGYGD